MRVYHAVSERESHNEREAYRHGQSLIMQSADSPHGLGDQGLSNRQLEVTPTDTSSTARKLIVAGAVIQLSSLPLGPTRPKLSPIDWLSDVEAH